METNNKHFLKLNIMMQSIRSRTIQDQVFVFLHDIRKSVTVHFAGYCLVLEIDQAGYFRVPHRGYLSLGARLNWILGRAMVDGATKEQR